MRRAAARSRLILAPLGGLAITAALTTAALLVLLDSGNEPPPPTESAQSTLDAEDPTPTAAATAEGSPSRPTAAAGTPSAATTSAADARPTLAPDLPDLVVREVFARDNQLVVVVANEGAGDADGRMEVAVDGGPPRRIDTGKALRPGDILERAVDGEYVQRRAEVSVTLLAPDIEENAANNTFEGVVAPDIANDVEVLGVGIDPGGGHVVVEVRNNSLIPLAGVITIEVRQSATPDRLLLRAERPLDVAAGATSRYELTELTGIDPASVVVVVSTDAISDADSANNTFPR